MQISDSKIKQWEAYQFAITSIYAAHSEEVLSRLIKETLPAQCHVDRIELLDNPPNDLSVCKKKAHRKPTQYIHPSQHNSTTYFICFYKQTGILHTQKVFLKKIAQALSMSLNRLEQYNQLKNKKEQWELAFDTISTPLCLTDMNNYILRTNKTFRDKTHLSKDKLLQKNYFQVFFRSPAKHSIVSTNENKKRIKRILNNKEECFEISVQKISLSNEPPIQLVIFRDITEQIKIEKKIAKSAQAMELGIISSSIAHELNNPIGGIHALLQILQINNKNNPELANDLKEMSLAIQRCMQIIHRLLHIPQ